MPLEKSLEWKIEEAIIRWLADIGAHGINLGIVARHFEEDKTDRLTLPAIIVQAQRQEQIHPNIAVFIIQADITLRLQADDATETALQTAANGIERIMLYDLADALTIGALELKVDGVVHRHPGAREISERHWDWVYTVVVGAQSTQPVP